MPRKCPRCIFDMSASCAIPDIPRPLSIQRRFLPSLTILTHRTKLRKPHNLPPPKPLPLQPRPLRRLLHLLRQIRIIARIERRPQHFFRRLILQSSPRTSASHSPSVARFSLFPTPHMNIFCRGAHSPCRCSGSPAGSTAHSPVPFRPSRLTASVSWPWRRWSGKVGQGGGSAR